MRDIIAAGGSKSKYSIGDQIPTLTGQQTGNINKGFDEWAANNNDEMGSSCDDWDASHSYTNGKLQIAPKCQYRVVLVPIINEWPQGNKDVTILGFAQMYIAGFDANDNGKITAIFLDDSYAHPDIVLGAVDSYGTRVARIVQ
jgi:hypothetical protein